MPPRMRPHRIPPPIKSSASVRRVSQPLFALYPESSEGSLPSSRILKDQKDFPCHHNLNVETYHATSPTRQPSYMVFKATYAHSAAGATDNSPARSVASAG